MQENKRRLFFRTRSATLSFNQHRFSACSESVLT